MDYPAPHMAFTNISVAGKGTSALLLLLGRFVGHHGGRGLPSLLLSIGENPDSPLHLPDTP